MRPTWTEVSLPRLRENFRSIQQHVGKQVTVCAVVKADAYGHGATECARALEQAGATWFGVTSTEEGVALRNAGVSARVLLMTGYWKDEEEEVVAHQLTPVVWDPWHIRRLARAAAKLQRAPFPVHLKVDTGMARLGASRRSLPDLLDLLSSNRALRLEGVCTHLKSAEILDAPDVRDQLECFAGIRKTIERAGVHTDYYHVANTAALASHPDTWNNMVRPGIALYGYHLHFSCDESSVPISVPLVKPVLSWKTRVLSLHEVGANASIGYDGAYVTSAPTRLAVLPVGYADGLSRQMSSRGRVLIHGAYASMVGNIAMDITTVDVTDLARVRVGDEVTLIGSDGSGCLTAWEQARIQGTIPYEVLCRIGGRVRREYVDPPSIEEHSAHISSAGAGDWSEHWARAGRRSCSSGLERPDT